VQLLGGVAAEPPVVAQRVHGRQREITIAAGRQEVEHARVKEEIHKSVLPADIFRALGAHGRRYRDLSQRQSFGDGTSGRTQLDV